MILPFGRGLNPYATPELGRWPAREMYCPHPATNWGLNPAYAPHGVRLHTVEGFRKTAPAESLLDWLAGQPGLPRVYAYGQSSTYCTNLLGLGQAWPDKLAGLLPGRAAVVNAGIGGHSGLQSLVRLMAWGPLLRPALTIIYTCKNDLTALRVSGGGERRVHPDWQNIVNSYGWALWRKLTRHRPSIALAFRDTGGWAEGDAGGLERFDQGCFDAVVGRFHLAAQLAAQWGGRVLFVSEVIQPSAYQPLMDRISDALPGVAAGHANATCLDVRPLLPQDATHFEDKLHLTEAGCTALAGLVAGAIHDQGLLAATGPAIPPAPHQQD